VRKLKDKKDWVEVLRHSKFVRSCHWGIVLTCLFLILTGIQLAFGYEIVDDPQALHLRLGIVFLGLWGLFAYFAMTEEWKWITPKRIPYSIKFVMEEAVAWVRGDHVEDPRAYDPKRKEYVEKVIPSQVLVWWTYVALTLVIGLTGLVLYDPELFKPFMNFADRLAMLFGINGYALVRGLHRFTMFLYITVAILHAYAATIFDTLHSMIYGTRREKVAWSSSKKISKEISKEIVGAGSR
jgi:formate dehydrogenase subunit gamma